LRIAPLDLEILASNRCHRAFAAVLAILLELLP